MSGNVKCPTHGEHGVLSHGRCWYCVQEGRVADPTASNTESKNKVVLAYKESK